VATPSEERGLIEQLHIGLDLDNTIISYDIGFAEVAEEMGLLPAGHGLRTKDAVKSYLWALPDGERVWMRLQGQMYGRHIEHGRICDGVEEFLRRMHEAGARLSIVSHKTKYGHFDESQVNLWDAALGWLERRGLFSAELGLRRENVHFKETREAKLETVGRIGCHLFIDDLPEVLLHRDFPTRTHGLLFAAGRSGAPEGGLVPYSDWSSVLQAVRILNASRARCSPLP
jgi:hypothetical protein